MDPRWVKILRKHLKPRGPQIDVPTYVYRQSATDEYLQRPPPGFMNWDKKVLNQKQNDFLLREITDILKQNEKYLYLHPQVIAILCLLIQSLAKTKPSDIKRHIKAKLKDPLFVGKVNLFLFEHGFDKFEDIVEHDEETKKQAKRTDKHYEGIKYYENMFRSDLPQSKRVKKVFKRCNWREPYPDYIIKRRNTLQITLPHFIKNRQQIFPLKPTF
ncbi:uncharacterized protein isoform X2 [Rhodnius prolixus]|uniref:Uncharacterized protein n=1 Tax=Rhodnius prolixus TaxID=13249 RepID=T1HYH1_RHOPR